MKKVTWTIKYVNEFVEPYYSTKDNTRNRHLNSEEWEVSNSDLAIQVLRDFLDAPNEELTVEQIKEDFKQPDVEESKYVQIKNYYNGRLALFKQAEVDILSFRDSEGADEKTFRYDIPPEYNSFAMHDSDECEQKQAYIEVVFKSIEEEKKREESNR